MSNFSFTENTLLTLFHTVECNGTEESLFDCQSNEGDGGCSGRQDASVICQGNQTPSQWMAENKEHYFVLKHWTFCVHACTYCFDAFSQKD